MKKIHLKIENMSCINCQKSITKNTECIEGILDAKIDFISGKGEFLANKNFNENVLLDKINKMGFKAQIIQKEQKLDKKNKKKNRLNNAVVGFCLILCVILFFNDNLILSFILSSIVLILCGIKIYTKALKLAIYGDFGMDFLITSGSLICYFYSIFANGHSYFFESAFIVTFVYIGKTIEIYTKNKINQYLDDLINEDFPKIKVLKDKSIELTDPKNIKIDDIVLFNQSEKILLDGVCLSPAICDMSEINGEFLSKAIKTNDEIKSGAVVLEGCLKLQVKKTFLESFHTKLLMQTNNLFDFKLKITKLVDICSKYFVIFVGFLSALIFSFYYVNYGLDIAIHYALNVLLVSCPCALGIAVPLVLSISINLALKNKIIISNPMILENFKNIKRIVLDKTGTLCKSELSILKCTINDDDLAILKGIESKSTHPIANAILGYKNIKPKQINNEIQMCDGGIKCGNILVGNADFVGIDDNTHDIYMSIDKEIKGGITFGNILKDDAKEIILFFQKNGIKTGILSGDKKENVEKIANELGIKEYFYNINPNEKLNILNSFNEKIAYAGDGLNDLLALSKADISISFSMANHLAQKRSDAIILGEKLTSMKTLFQISKIALFKIKQNLFLSFSYNLIMIFLACGVFKNYGIILSPSLCVIFMFLSSISVILNSALMLRKTTF